MTKWPTTLALATFALGACPGSSTTEPAKGDATKAAAPAEAGKGDAAKGELAKAEPGKAPEPAKAEEAPKPAEEAPKPAEPVAGEPVAGEPGKPGGLVGGPLPAAKDKATPAVVFAALADRNSREWEVDIVDFAGMDVEGLEKALEEQMKKEWERRQGGEESEEDELGELPNIFGTKGGKALVPKGFAVGDPWTLVTPEGSEHRTAKGMRAVSMEGSGQLHFYVQLGKAPAGTEKPAVALRGHLPATTKLVVPKPEAPTDVTPLASALAAKLDPEARTILQGRPMKATDVKLYAGRFPGQRTHAAFVMADDENDDNPPISAFLFTKSDGSVEVAVIPDVLGTVELLGLLDVDGDGRDEVFYEDAYHEGWYLMMLQWEGDTPSPRVLTGDGL